MPFVYIVKKGDTLFRIARRHAVNGEALLAANPELTGSEPVVPGQVIRIPDRPVNRYVIQAGDTLAFIAKRFRLEMGEVAAANPGIDPSRLRIGQWIVLPVSTAQPGIRTELPYGYPELMEDLHRMKERFPFLELQTIGRSVLGKELCALRIGGGRRELHANAAVHANEWVTTPVLMHFAWQYAEAIAAGTAFRGCPAAKLAERTSLWLVPMVNPDGVELVHESITPQHPLYEELLQWNNGSFTFSRWKANARGVDLNDQFPAHWETERDRRDVPGPGPRNYPGEAPLSEPEAAALAAFTKSRDFQLVVSLHTQGQEIYWNYRDMEPPEAELLAAVLARASGYKAVKLSGSDAGYKDWFIQEYGRPGFTVELGFGVNPLPLTQFPDLYESAADLLLACMDYTAET